MEIRPATEDDIDQMVSLHVELHEGSAAEVPSRLRVAERYDESTQRAYLVELMTGRSVCLIAVDGEEAVGLAEVRLREPEQDPGVVPVRRGYLQSLVVRRQRRGEGIGGSLLEASEEWARSNGADEMELDHWIFEGDPGAFYKCAGYRSLSVMRVKPLH
jgi:GNAT superfamily N-acetyltransferase